MSDSAGLAGWLAGHDEPAVAALLRARPDAARPPEPRSLQELAGRLANPHGVSQALTRVSRPALQLGEAVLALGGRASRAQLHSLLGEPDPRQVDEALAELGAMGLAWPAGDEVCVPGAWRNEIPAPLGVGRSGTFLYGQLTAKQLARIGEQLGIRGPLPKQEWVAAVLAAVADPDTVEARLRREDSRFAGAVRRIATDGIVVAGVRIPGAYERPDPDDAYVRLALQGWLVPVDGYGEMPREVAFAIRGPGYRAPFDPEPPLVRKVATPVSSDTPAARAALDAMRALLRLLDTAPLATRRDGGIGTRELRKAAKELKITEEQVRLLLELGAARQLLAPTKEAALPTRFGDEWLEEPPAAALRALLLAWLVLWKIPRLELDPKGKPAAALRHSGSHAISILRADVLHELERERGILDPAELAAALAFRAPLATGTDAADRVGAVLAEAEFLGVVENGALTAAGAALVAAAQAADPAAALDEQLAELVPPPATTARFLPDLTALVAGSPAAALAELLDSCGVLEGRDTASTWRFTSESVRAALDAGTTASGLLAALAEVAEGTLPQPLEYLVRDVARRHGQVQVFAVASCIRVVDAALGAELAAHRALAGLELRKLADTVLASTSPVEQTIAALRKAGYAPIRQDEHGEAVVERAPHHRAELPRAVRQVHRPHDPYGPERLAQRLLRGAPAPPPTEDFTHLHPDEVPYLDGSQVAVLSHAIAHRLPVRIDYVNAAGNPSSRVVEPRWKLLGTLVAYCHDKQDERNFTLDRIQAVSPASG